MKNAPPLSKVQKAELFDSLENCEREINAQILNSQLIISKEIFASVGFHFYILSKLAGKHAMQGNGD